MLLYPLLTGWAARELEQKIKKARLESVRASESRKTAWLTFFDARQALEKKKFHLFFSFQSGCQLFFFAPAAEAKTRFGWESFDTELGGAYLKNVRQQGSNSIVEILFTCSDTSPSDDFSLRFILFGKDTRMEFYQPATDEKPTKSWPISVEHSPRKENGFELSLSSAEKFLNDNPETSLDEALRKALRIPSFLALELLQRAQIDGQTNFGSLSAELKTALRAAVRLLFEAENFAPTLYFEKEKLKGISPFPLSSVKVENQKQFASFLDSFSYAAVWNKLKKYEKKLEAEKEDLEKRKEKIEAELKSYENPERLRQMGDLILSAKDRIRPRASELITENWYENPAVEIRIPLDPAKTARQNAAVYFSKFQKAARALKLLPERIKETEAELEKVDKLLKRIAVKGMAEEKWLLAQELETLYPPPAVAKRQKAKEKPQIGWTFWTKDGFKFRVGRNSEENDRLTLREAGKNDLFLHASQSPGSHVILVAEKRPFSKEAILEAAAAAAYFSKARHSTKVNVDFAEVRYVQKPRKAKPGLVVLIRSKSVMVYPKKPERQKWPDKE
ncbi:MAG TPA: NFACT RNA binding domain-containing protein [Verrucomicrobiae bacterium]|nr:NFACT RNA binding domain-containing protein [Verrucomicrobiae bacterium]